MLALICSDLHDEFYDEFNSVIKTQLKYTKADILLLPGDICTFSNMYRLKCLEIPTYYVTGNHELYGISWDHGVSDYQHYFKDTNITVLENETVAMPGSKTRIISASLWTDFWAPVAIGKEYHGNNCLKGMSDFSLIRGLTLNKWEERHKKSLKFIKKELSKKHDGPTLVMTHHAPSFKSSHSIYQNSPISGGFCSDLDYLIEEYQPDYWIHGHCHESFDYKIGKTRVLANPRGYPHELNPDFNLNLLIEL